MFAPPRSFSQLTTTFFARQLLRHPPWTLSRLTIFCDYALFSYHFSAIMSRASQATFASPVVSNGCRSTDRSRTCRPRHARMTRARSFLSFPFPIRVKDHPQPLQLPASKASVATNLPRPTPFTPACYASALSTRVALPAPLRRVA